MKIKKNKAMIIIVIIIGFIVIVIKNSIIITFPKAKEQVIGIIDSSINEDIKSSIFFQSYMNSVPLKEKSHGDNLIGFAKKINKEVTIYYYDASDDRGKINTDAIIEGLEWLKKNNVTNINISLSSTHYSVELEKYIKENNNFFTIFASYNNNKSTFDYPAMYKFVTGVGTKNILEKKDNDIYHNTSTVFIIKKPFKIYKGNSYISLLETIKHID